MKKISLKTIANELGVSSATVSLVLNGKDKNGRVSKELSKKILEKAAELNYIPNTLAKSLKVGKSNTIGLIIADISNIFFGTLALYIQNFAQQKGYTVIIGNTNENLNEMELVINFLSSRQVDGFIITPTEKSQDLLNKLTLNNIPLVLVDRTFPELNVNSVMINNYEISYKATEQLIKNKLLPFLRQFLFTYKLVSWDSPAGLSQETKRPSGIFPPAFYIPIPDGAFPYYNTSYTPLFCDINPNRYQTAQDRSSRT